MSVNKLSLSWLTSHASLKQKDALKELGHSDYNAKTDKLKGKYDIKDFKGGLDEFKKTSLSGIFDENELADLFAIIDRNGDGKLSKKELEYLASLGSNKATDKIDNSDIKALLETANKVAEESVYEEPDILEENPTVPEDNYNKPYNVNDLKEVLNIINNNPNEYNMLLDPNSDGIIDEKDLQIISLNLYSGKSIDEIKKSNLSNNSNVSSNKINEKIGYSQQGGTGDCYLLATLNSLKNTPKGRKIIKDAIKDNKDGTYTVSFPGVDTSITITDVELQNFNDEGLYSSGDDDVLLMEIATEKIMDLIKNGKVDAPDFLKIKTQYDTRSITAGYLNDVIYLLTGDIGEFAVNLDEINDVNLSEIKIYLADNQEFASIDETLDKMKNNPEKYAAFLTFLPNDKGESDTVKDINGNEVSLQIDHAWTLKSVNKDTVTIINPWDSSKEITISRKELEKHIQCINYYDLSEYKGKQKCSDNIQYDENGNRFEKTEEKDENGNIISTTINTYDKDNNLIKTTSLDKDGNTTGIVETEYDSKGNIKQTSVTENNYDKNGKIIGSTKKVYNKKGILLYTEESQYNKNGNLTNITRTRKDGTIAKTVQIKFDSENNVIKNIVDYDKNGKVKSKTKEIWDKDGEMTSETVDKNGKLIAEREITIDSDGKKIDLIKKYNEDGSYIVTKTIYSKSGRKLDTYKFNEDGKELSHKQYNADGSIWSSSKYKYNKDGTKTNTITYYTEKGKKITGKSIDVYDKNGNLKSKIEYEYENGKRKSKTTIKFNKDGTKTAIKIEYDENGNKIKTTKLKYDKDGKQIE